MMSLLSIVFFSTLTGLLIPQKKYSIIDESFDSKPKILLSSNFMYQKKIGKSLGEKYLPVIKAKGGGGRSIDYRGYDINKLDEYIDPGPYADSYFINGCDGGNIAPKSMKCSSTLPAWQNKNYSIKNLLDRNPTSAWVEGVKGYGQGEWFEIYCNNLNTIYNGYQSSPANWINNSRVKRFKIYIDGRPLCYLDLTDEMGEQNFELPFDIKWDKGHLFRFEIVEVYPGEKWDDVCISEIGVQGCCVEGNQNILLGDGLMQPLKLAANSTISVFDSITNPTLKQSEILKKTKRTHFTLINISTSNGSISVTPEHKLIFKDYGSISLMKLREILNCKTYEELIKHNLQVYFYKDGKTLYMPLINIAIEKGVFETFSIRQTKTGKYFIINGFVQETDSE